LLAIFFLSLFPVVSSAAPAAHFDALSYDAGVVGQDKKVEHVFEFTNTGDQDLVIQKVTAS